MYTGQWQGTMALTEPQAGSSLTDITTSAQPTPEGFYRIKGQKIFISAGDHSGAENFVHLTLARIEGAPPGVKGISLFVIPRLRPGPNNELIFNDVQTAGDFQKRWGSAAIPPPIWSLVKTTTATAGCWAIRIRGWPICSR